MRLFERAPWAVLAALAACGEDDQTTPDGGSETATPVDDDGLDLAGSYDDAFGTHHEISSTEWVQQYAGYDPLRFGIVAFDDDAGVVIAENDAGNAFSPGRFSRFDWLAIGADRWYCQTVFDAPTAEDAEAAAPADDADVATGGCGGSMWTLLTP